MRLSASRFVGLTLVGFGALALNVCGGGGSSPGGPVQPTAPPVADPHAGPPGGVRALRELRQAARWAPHAVVQDRHAGLPGRRGRGHPHAAGGAAADLPGATRSSASAPTTSGSSRSSTARGSVPPPRAKSWASRDPASYNEQYDVLSAKNGARFGPVSYRATCSPSAVPTADPGAAPAAGGLPAGAQPRGRVRTRAGGPVLRRRRGGHHADPEGEAGAVRLHRHQRPGSDFVRDPQPRRLQQGHGGHHDRQGLLREARRRGAGRSRRARTRAASSTTWTSRGQVHPARPGHLPRQLLPGRVLTAPPRSIHSRGVSGGSGGGGAAPPRMTIHPRPLLLVDRLEHAGRVEPDAVAPVQREEGAPRASARSPAPPPGSSSGRSGRRARGGPRGRRARRTA